MMKSRWMSVVQKWRLFNIVRRGLEHENIYVVNGAKRPIKIADERLKSHIFMSVIKFVEKHAFSRGEFWGLYYFLSDYWLMIV